MGLFDGVGDLIGDLALPAADAAGVATTGVPWGSIASAGIGAVGSYLGQNSANNANQSLMYSNNAYNAAEADKNRQFQSDQRKTQYQTAVEDLKAAGLNPMLAYTQGGAKPTSGAQATASAPPKIENALGNAANSAATSAMAMNNVMSNRLIEAQIQKTNSESDNIFADTINKYDTNPNIKTENKRLLSQIAFNQSMIKLNSAQEYSQRAGIAPSADPWWYRDVKRIGANAASAFGIKFNR